jgi:capsular polysaccharide biosynthesis protein
METYDAQPRDWEEAPDLLQSIWHYKWLIAVAALLGMLVGYGWAARQPTLYEAVSEVLLTGTAGAPLPDGQPQPIGDPDRYLQNQATLIGTTPVLELAAQKTKGKASVEDLRQRMNVDAGQKSDVITVSVFDGNAENAADFANAIAEGYEDFVEGQPGLLANQLRSNRTKLEARLAQVTADLATAPNDASLRRRRDALVDELKQIERNIAAAEASVGTNLVNLELAVPPEQPAEPAPRRTMAVGALVGLVVSIALAWWLNSRRAGREARTEWQRSQATGALPARDHDLAPENQGWAAAPESLVVAGRRPDAVATKNGERRHGTIGRLMWRIKQWHSANAPNTTRNEVRDGSGAFGGMGDEGFATPVSENGEETSLSRLFASLDRALTKEPLDFYWKALPQAMAEELPYDVPADMVAILLDDGEGFFRVAGNIGLDPGEQDLHVDQNHEQLRRALWNGLSVLQGREAVGGAAAGIPGLQRLEALLIVPLVQGRTWLGVLLIGRRDSPGQLATPFSDGEIADAVLCGMELAAITQSVLLANRLRDALGAFEPSSERPEQAPSHTREPWD